MEAWYSLPKVVIYSAYLLCGHLILIEANIVAFQPVKSKPIANWRILSILSVVASCSILASPMRVVSQPTNSSNQIAETKEMALTIVPETKQTFAALMQQAESMATNAIEQEFAQNSQTTEITVSILGERNGQEAPLLLTKVSRADWQKQPQLAQWTQHFNSSAVLLGFSKPQRQQPTAGSPANTSRSSTPANSTRQRPTSPTPPNTITSPNPGTSIQQPTAPTVPNQATPPALGDPSPQPIAPVTFPSNFPQQPSVPTVPNSATPGGASLEENDPGYR